MRAVTPTSSDAAESIASEPPMSSIHTAEDSAATATSAHNIVVESEEYDSDFEDMSTGGEQETSTSSGHTPRPTVAQVRATVMCDVHTQTTATTSVDVQRTQLEHVLTKSLSLDYYDHGELARARRAHMHCSPIQRVVLPRRCIICARHYSHNISSYSCNLPTYNSGRSTIGRR